MTTSSVVPEPFVDLRCSTYSRTHEIDLIGTAGSYAGYLLVEWPNPWPSDLAVVDELASVAAAASAAGLRLQGLVARAGTAPRSVICYRSTEGAPFTTYRGLELRVTPSEVAEAACALADGSDGEPVGAERQDLLICTHGRRDRCCGSLGTELALQVDRDVELLPSSVRRWRTSHTGGHRFAPNAILLPSGTVWGYLDAARLAAVVTRAGAVDDALRSYRGCAGLPSPELQILERAVISEIGWSVLDGARHGYVARTASGDGYWLTTIEVVLPDGSSATWSGEVLVGRDVPIPDCGIPIEQSQKIERELTLRNFKQLR